MYKIGVIGDRDSVLCFRTIGFEVFAVSDLSQASSVLKKIAAEDYAVIFVVQDFFSGLDGVFEKYYTSSVPAIISIPGRKGSDGSGMAQIKSAMERAIGADISAG